MTSRFTVISTFFCICFVLGSAVTAQTANREKHAAASEDKQAGRDLSKVDAELHKATVRKAIEYLLSKGQYRDDGSYSKNLGPAVTAMCTTSLLKNGIAVDHPQIKKSLQLLVRSMTMIKILRILARLEAKSLNMQ